MAHRRHRYALLATCLGIAALGIAALGATTTASAATRPASTWPQYRHGADHRGWNPDETTLTPAAVPRLTSKWSHPVTGSAPVAVSGGVVYSSGSDGLHAYDAVSGRSRWTATLPGGDTFRSGPAVSGGRVFVGTAQGSVAALDARTGTRLWSTRVGVNPLATAPTVSGSLVYSNGDETVTDRAVLYALDPATGAVRWRSQPAGGLAFREVAVAGGVAYFSGGNDHLLHALDATTGSPLWTAPVEGLPVPAGGRVYLTGNLTDGFSSLIALDAKTGKSLWTTRLVGGATAAAVDGTRVYVAVDRISDDSRSVYAFDPATGTASWHSAWVPGHQFDSMSAVTVAGGVVYLDAADHLRGYAASNGALRWTAPNAGTGADAVVAGGRLYVVTADSRGTTSVRAFGI